MAKKNTKNAVICVKGGGEKIVIPWTPDSIDISGEARVAEYEIINKGQYQVPTGTNLRSVSWQSTFPGEKHQDLPFMHKNSEGKILGPIKSVSILDKWRKNGTIVSVLIYERKDNVTYNYFDHDCLLSDYSASLTGGLGDIGYSVTFTEYRKIKISAKKKSKKRPKTHKVKKGETLHSISVKYWGNGKKRNSLYKWNKKVIENAAKKHKKKSSKKGKYLYAGTVLKLYPPKKASNKKAYTGSLPKLPKRGYFKKGDKGKNVKLVQKFLKWYGYKLSVDGDYGSHTASTVKKFQKAVGLKATGKVDSKTLSKMKSVKK